MITLKAVKVSLFSRSTVFEDLITHLEEKFKTKKVKFNKSRQFQVSECAESAVGHGFENVTLGLKNPQNNDKSEREVKLVIVVTLSL